VLTRHGEGVSIRSVLRTAELPQERQEEAGKPWDPAAGSAPLVFAGGPTATSNPEPFADFFDFFALGDGEELLVSSCCGHAVHGTVIRPRHKPGASARTA
jgi:radical SAM superfamily enzyme YgiQ (UPF0313 family)